LPVSDPSFHPDSQRPNDIFVACTHSEPPEQRRYFSVEKMSQEQAEQNIQMWKVRKLIKSLDSARGWVLPAFLSSTQFLIRITSQRRYFDDQFDHTSQSTYVTVLWDRISPGPFRPQDQLPRINAMLTQEYSAASNIKSRVNRTFVLAAIASAQQRLKLYNRTPPNGLVLFVGTISTDEGKEKMVSFDFEPHKPINTCVFSISYLGWL